MNFWIQPRRAEEHRPNMFVTCLHLSNRELLKYLRAKASTPQGENQWIMTETCVAERKNFSWPPKLETCCLWIPLNDSRWRKRFQRNAGEIEINAQTYNYEYLLNFCVFAFMRLVMTVQNHRNTLMKGEEHLGVDLKYQQRFSEITSLALACSV